MIDLVGDLIKLDGPPMHGTVIALRGIIAVHRDPDALSSDPTEVVLEGGMRIRVSRLDGVFIREAWEVWTRGKTPTLGLARLAQFKAAVETPATQPDQPLTADTITDRHIEQLLLELEREGNKTNYGACVVALHDQPTPPRAVRAAMERCAELINARRAKADHR